MSSVYFRSIWNTNNLFIKNGAINTPSYNTVDQNNLIAEYGQILYNSTTNTVNFFSNTGTWNPIVPTNNITIGNLNFNNNTISSTTGDIILFPNSAVVKITGTLNMQTNNIINVGTINTLALPTSTFVGINDSQVLTNKTINGSQLVNNSVSLAKMSTLTPNTIIGNNTGFSATPLALDVNNVRAMLFLNLVENISLSTWAGSIYLNTVAPGAISLTEMANLSANTIIGNNTGVSATPIALSVTNVKTMLGLDNNFTIGNLNFNNNTISSTTGDIILFPNSAIVKITGSLNMQTNNIINVGTINTFALPTSTFVGINDSQVLTNKTINGSQLVNNSVSLAKMSTLTPNTIIGNNTGVSATPIALSTSDVKTMLGLVNNVTFGDLNINNNIITTSSSNITGRADFITWDSEILSSILGHLRVIITAGGAASLDLINEIATIRVTGTMDMQTYNITNVGTINTFALPTSTFVGINDSQVLTNKTINGSQLVNNSVSLAKMSTLTANTIIGNNTGVSATPLALSVSNVKTMLGLDNNFTIGNLNFNNNTISSTTGDIILYPNSAVVKITGALNMQTNNIINVGNITSSGTVLLLNGTGSNFANVSTNNASFLVSSNVANQESYIGIDGPTTTNNRHIACYQNGIYRCSFGLSGIQYFYVSDTVASLELFRVNMGGGNNCIRFPTYSTNGILRIDSSVVTVDSNFTTSTNNINCDSITAKTTNSNLTLNGNGTGTVNTNAPYIYIANNRIDTDTSITLDGTTVTKSRYVACYQNAVHKLGFGLAASSYFFIWDNVNARDLFQASIITGNIRFPTYSTNGVLRIDSGTVTVENNFTTSTNTINCDSITAKTTNSNLTLNGNGTGTVVTNSPVIYIASNRENTDSKFSIDGPTITNARHIACYQNGVYKLGFGLLSSSHFFIWDNINNRELFQASIITGNIRFPTYLTNGVLRIDYGTVTVDSNFTTSTNTINVDTVIAKTTNSNLYIHPNGTGNVVTNSPVIYIASNRTNTDSAFSIDGPTVTNSRYIGCYQNGAYKLSFGLSASSHFFIYDPTNNKDLFHAFIGGGIRFPTYTTNGTLSVINGIGTVSSSSDRRLKQNEEALNPEASLQKIMNLQPKKYCWKSNVDKINIGFIAQDVEIEIPEAVDGKKFEYEFVRDGASQGIDGTIRLDEEGKPVLDYNQPRYRGLDQCAILSVLVSAFQELHNNINIKLSSIENRLTALETVINVS